MSGSLPASSHRLAQFLCRPQRSLVIAGYGFRDGPRVLRSMLVELADRSIDCHVIVDGGSFRPHLEQLQGTLMTNRQTPVARASQPPATATSLDALFCEVFWSPRHPPPRLVAADLTDHQKDHACVFVDGAEIFHIATQEVLAAPDDLQKFYTIWADFVPPERS